MKIKQLIAILLLLIFTAASFTSCENDREYDEAEVIRAAEELIRKSEPINEIYYGKGFLPSKEGKGIYKKVAEGECERLNVYSLDELKAKTKEIFSFDRAEMMINTGLTPIQDEEGNIFHYARYYEEKGEDVSYIMVNEVYEYQMTNSIAYDYSKISVDDVEGEIIVVKLPVTLTRKDGVVKNTELKIKMIEEEAGWRFFSASHAVYDENSDIYEELNNQIK